VNGGPRTDARTPTVGVAGGLIRPSPTTATARVTASTLSSNPCREIAARKIHPCGFGGAGVSLSIESKEDWPHSRKH
jgi:hypothetical protein